MLSGQFCKRFTELGVKGVLLLRSLVNHECYRISSIEYLIDFLIDSKYDLHHTIKIPERIGMVQNLRCIDGLWESGDFLAIRCRLNDGTTKVVIYEHGTNHFRQSIPVKDEQEEALHAFAPIRFGEDVLVIYSCRNIQHSKLDNFWWRMASFRDRDMEHYSSAYFTDSIWREYKKNLEKSEQEALDDALRPILERQDPSQGWIATPKYGLPAREYGAVPLVLKGEEYRWQIFAVPEQKEKDEDEENRVKKLKTAIYITIERISSH